MQHIPRITSGCPPTRTSPLFACTVIDSLPKVIVEDSLNYDLRLDSPRVPSTSATPPRRAPQQARAAIRRAKFLEVAANLIGEIGFDALTMTAIAEHAGASIGTLYDYFPDKQALGMAIMAQYTGGGDSIGSAS